MDTFLDILDTCVANLEHLHVRDSGPMLGHAVDHYPDPTRSITLPKLRRFVMGSMSNSTDLAYLQAHLVFPETASITLTVDHRDSRMGLLSVLLRIRTGIKSLKVIDELTFYFFSSNNLLMIEGNANQESDSGLLRVCLGWDDGADFETTIAGSFNALKDVFPPQVIKFKFVFDNEFTRPTISAAHWSQFFTHFTNIETLHLSYGYLYEMHPVWSALQTIDPKTMVISTTPSIPALVPPSPSLLCPKLRQLSVEATRQVGLELGPMLIPGQGLEWQLYQCLRIRRDHLIPSQLEKLTVKEVGPGWNDELLQDEGTDWPAISELVGEVEVEETEPYFSDHDLEDE